MRLPPADRTATRAPGSIQRESDFFYDELMTAQPDATREFLRARIAARGVQSAAPVTPRRRRD